MFSRLKSLELIGYKTFASKVNFEFPGRITAIVGPNGSGKSNIADSIRWVLGEQSYRMLRGRRTEDMIFAGSEGRSRAGMASASITFDNEDGWLPIEYAEVSVTRRAYRDGSNEYLLNGQKVRLRDIQELLAQSGLAERTYTLIGQGLVDAALSIRPEERRRFFEEAAGIGLYRSRREEAINRLDQTKRNLERVKDILSELEPRLRSLERQARRFMEYKTIQADLQVLLRDWYGYHWHHAQEELARSKQVLKERNHHLHQTSENYKKLEKKITELRNELNSLRERLNAWHEESAAYHKEREQVSRNLAVLDERQRSLTDQRMNFQTDQARLEEEVRSREEMISTLQHEKDTLAVELQTADSQFKNAQSDLADKRKQRDEIELHSRKIRRELVEKETRIVELRARINELTDRIESQHKSKTNLENDLRNSRKDLVDKKSRFENLQSIRDQDDANRKAIEENVNNISAQISDVQEEMHLLHKEYNHQQAEQARLNAQLGVLDQAEKSLSGLNLGAKTIIEAAKKGGIRGNYAPLSRFLNVPQKFEKAIAAALDTYLDAVLLIGESDPSDAIQLLAQQEKGRAVLLLVDRMEKNETVNEPVGGSVLGRASQLVSADQSVKPVIELLLGNTFIVENHIEAQPIARKMPASVRIVTLDGEVFFGNGTIIAGKENRSAVIARPRQKQELKDNLSEIDRLVKSLENQINSYESKIKNLQKKSDSTRQQLKEIHQAEQLRQKEINKASLAYDQAKQRHDWIKNQILSLDEQIEKATQLRNEDEVEIQEQERNLQKLREQMRNVSRSLEDVNLDELQSHTAHWQTNVAVAERALHQAGSRLEEYENLLAQNQQRLRSLVRRYEDIGISLSDLEEEKAVLRAQEHELQDKIDDLRKNITPAEDKLHELENQYSLLLEEQSNLQHGVSTAERYATQGQLDFSRQRDILDNLQRRIEEDFGLVAFEYHSVVSGPTPLPFDGLVEQLPKIDGIEPELEENINRQRAQLRRIGPINPDADEEFNSVKTRHEFITTQLADLTTADEDLRKVIEELDELMQREFKKTFDAVAAEFREMFTRLFGGGSARLYLTDEENFNQTGIDIEARLPGRREQGLSLLSGGERSLTAVALIFALLKVSPTPFCVLDEVDAALDEANVGRFCDLLRELSQKIQFIVITHNRNTVQASDVIYGITMGRDSASQMISLRLDEVDEELVS